MSAADRVLRDGGGASGAGGKPTSPPCKRPTTPRRRSHLLARLGRLLLFACQLSVAVVLCLRFLPPPTSAMMLEQRLTDILRGGTHPPIRYQWVDWEAISPEMGLAVVAAEDQKFPLHWGFDFESIAETVEGAKRGHRLRGASTITQQVAKNLFLWPGRSYLRKGLEAYFTLLLELLWPKERILEVYVNIAELGEGVYGVGAAAKSYLGKSPARLTRSEAALLAAVLPNPKVLSVRKPSAYVQERRQWIREQMGQLGGVAYLKSR